MTSKQKKALRKGQLLLKRASKATRRRWATKGALTRCKKREARHGRLESANPEPLGLMGPRHLSMCRDCSQNCPLSENPCSPATLRAMSDMLGAVQMGKIHADAPWARQALHNLQQQFPLEYTQYGGMQPSENPVVEHIRHGDRVTIVNRFGQKKTGRAVMRGPHGWVLNMGGAHGTPAIADESNIVHVKQANNPTMEDDMRYESALNPELLLIGAGNPGKRKKRARHRHKARKIRFRKKLVSRQKLIKLIGKLRAAKLWKKKCKSYRRGCKKLGYRGKRCR